MLILSNVQHRSIKLMSSGCDIMTLRTWFEDETSFCIGPDKSCWSVSTNDFVLDDVTIVVFANKY